MNGTKAAIAASEIKASAEPTALDVNKQLGELLSATQGSPAAVNATAALEMVPPKSEEMMVESTLEEKIKAEAEA